MACLMSEALQHAKDPKAISARKLIEAPGKISSSSVTFAAVRHAQYPVTKYCQMKRFSGLPVNPKNVTSSSET